LNRLAEEQKCTSRKVALVCSSKMNERLFCSPESRLEQKSVGQKSAHRRVKNSCRRMPERFSAVAKRLFENGFFVSTLLPESTLLRAHFYGRSLEKNTLYGYMHIHM